MTHRAFARGFKTSASAASANKGVGGFFGRRAKMPLPESGTGGWGTRKQSPARGAGGCGDDQFIADTAGSLGPCGEPARGQVASLFSTITTTLAPLASTTLTAQVTGTTAFKLASVAINDRHSSDVLFTAITSPAGMPLLQNAQPVRGDYFSNKNEIGGRVNGCSVGPALTVSFTLQNISTATLYSVQVEAKGLY